MNGFFSISLTLRPIEEVEYIIGFKSFSAVTDRRQFIEPAFGLKSISVCINHPGQVIKTNHFKIIEPD